MSRVTIAIAVFALIVGAYVLVIEPVSESRAGLREKLESSYATLQKNESFIERTRKTGMKLDDVLRELRLMEAYVIQATDVSVASARLQSRIQEMAREAGVEVTSIKPLPVVEANGYNRLPIYMEGQGDITGLSAFLRELDSTQDFISIDTLGVLNMTRNRLRIKMQFSGLMKR